jgi:hypothetical protein
MLFLAKSFICACLVALNFYGAALLFYQPLLLKKIGQLLVLLVPVILLHLVLKRVLPVGPSPAVPFLSLMLFLLLMLAGLPSQKTASSVSATFLPFKFSQEQLTGNALFFTVLVPALLCAIQVMTLLK